jgi:hypothetical protein
MKKVILCAALMIGCVAFANARFTVSSATVSTEVTNGDYKEVALADLSDVVQEAVKNLAGEVYEVKKLEFDAEKELTRVTLTQKEDNTEKVVLLNKEGKEVEE